MSNDRIAIDPKVRQEVLQRDGRRCQAAQYFAWFMALTLLASACSSGPDEDVPAPATTLTIAVTPTNQSTPWPPPTIVPTNGPRSTPVTSVAPADSPTPVSKSSVAPAGSPTPVSKNSVAPADSSTPASKNTVGTPIELNPAPTFVASGEFDPFSEGTQAAFFAALSDEFAAAHPKAGVSVAVFDGNRLWTEALGIASATASMTPTTPMVIRSTSKTFLSAMMLTQIENGLYKLTDTVESLLSDHPDYSLIDIEYVNTGVTVEQLLTMTSGISDWSAPEDLDRRMAIMLAPTWKPADNLAQISSPFVEPGSYHYSYANSILLGLIATHHGGKKVDDLYRELFFEPLGLSGALLTEAAEPPDTARPHDHLAIYGAGEGFGDLNAGRMAIFAGKDPRVSWVGASIVSTPENIARWGYELFSSSGAAVSSEVRNQLINSLKVEPTSLTGIGVHTYGYYIGAADVSLSDGTRIKTYTHPGGGGGRTSWLYYAPSLDVSVSLLANSMVLHEPGSCQYQGRVYVHVGECMAGGIFSTLLGKPVVRTGG